MHEALVKEAFGVHTVVSISRNVALRDEEKPAHREMVKKIKNRRGRPLKWDTGEVKVSKLQMQLGQTLVEKLAEISTKCDLGT